MPNNELLTPQELADFLDVKLSTVYYWSHIGFIPRIKVGRHLRFKRSSIQTWLEKRERPGRAKRSLNGTPPEIEIY